ncbi:hypothetical protein E3N88_06878 [Mikania micrantha]|uniref:Uncharacterized protein n=1 Tax=Mikania micrantha TaxID=192012 RepID=A0A5N6PR04_9ASTR|nr:hypothetical protein E3N88_06878 [Mikania micrantha]
MGGDITGVGVVDDKKSKLARALLFQAIPEELGHYASECEQQKKQDHEVNLVQGQEEEPALLFSAVQGEEELSMVLLNEDKISQSLVLVIATHLFYDEGHPPFILRRRYDRSDWEKENRQTKMWEHGAFTLFPKMLPIGPLLATVKSTRQVGHFSNEDSTCLTWLAHQPVRSAGGP